MVSEGAEEELQHLLKALHDVDPPLPQWFREASASGASARAVVVREWADEQWRVSQQGGFRGLDFCHSRLAAVRVLDYVLLLPPINPTDSQSGRSDSSSRIEGDGCSPSSPLQQELELPQQQQQPPLPPPVPPLSLLLRGRC